MSSQNEQIEDSTPVETSPSADTENKELHETQFKFLREVLKSVYDCKNGEIFRVPVDPERDNVPDYFEVINQPMDLNTMTGKLEVNEYNCPDDCISDFRLMISNCNTYNPEGSVARYQGKELEKFFNKKMLKFPSELPLLLATKRRASVSSPRQGDETKRETVKITPKTRKSGPGDIITRQAVSVTTRESLRPVKRSSKDINEVDRPLLASAMSFCESALNELSQKRHSEYATSFLEPVDPVSLGIPDYFDVIKCPMDLNTIRTKLKGGHYAHPQHLIRDVRLMFTNCYRYNAETTEVYGQAVKLQRVFEQFIASCPGDLYFDLFISEEIPEESVQLSAVARTTRRSHVIENRQIIESLHGIERRVQQISDDIGKIKTERPSRVVGIIENGQTVVKKTTPKPPPNHLRPISNIHACLEPSKVDDADPMTYDEKLALSSKIMCLSETRIKEVIGIINHREPWYRRASQASNKSTLEIDLESLQPGTLRALEKFVTVANRKKSDASYRKKISADDRITREQELRRRLEDMDSQLSGKTPIAIGGRHQSISETKKDPLVSRLSESSSDSDGTDDEFSRRYALTKTASSHSNLSNPLRAATTLLNRLPSSVAPRPPTAAPRPTSQLSPAAKILKTDEIPSSSKIQSSFLGKLGVSSCENGAQPTPSKSQNTRDPAKHDQLPDDDKSNPTCVRF